MLEAQSKFLRAQPDFQRAFALDPSNELARQKADELAAKLIENGMLEESSVNKRGSIEFRGSVATPGRGAPRESTRL